MELTGVHSNGCPDERQRWHRCGSKCKRKEMMKEIGKLELLKIRRERSYSWPPPSSRTMEPTKDLASPKSMSVLSR
jgi:hypothetical protein